MQENEIIRVNYRRSYNKCLKNHTSRSQCNAFAAAFQIELTEKLGKEVFGQGAVEPDLNKNKVYKYKLLGIRRVE